MKESHVPFMEIVFYEEQDGKEGSEIVCETIRFEFSTSPDTRWTFDRLYEEVKKGMNSGSSDIDFEDLTIIGNGKAGSIGLDIIGYDNTFSNMHIYDFEKGVRCNSGGNSFRNIQVYYTHAEKTSKIVYSTTVGIEEIGQGNFYYHCYVENYATAYSLNGTMEIVDNCRAKWTSNNGGVQTAFKTKEAFNSCFSNVRVEFYDSSTINTVFSPQKSGSGKFESPMITVDLCDNKLGETWIRNTVIPLS